MKEYSKTVSPQGCPKCMHVAICEAAMHDFKTTNGSEVELVGLRCEKCGHVWPAVFGIQIREPDGDIVVIGAAVDRAPMSFGEAR